MPDPIERLRAIKNFGDLTRYLEEELDWPLQQFGFDDLTFEYQPAELGLKEAEAAKISRIHQLRPLRQGQPWGIFFVEFERKKLPVMVLRRILSHLVVKKRASANRPDAAAWQVGDLLFIAAFGDSSADNDEIAFAHFHQQGTELPTLRVLGWDGGDTPLKLEHVAATLREKLRWPENLNDHDAWRAVWSGLFRHRVGHVIRTADALAEALAALARRIRQAALVMLAHESEQGALHNLHKAFQTALIHDLSEADFADTYAQTITYGLLTAAISRTDRSEGVYGTALIAENVTDMVPITNPFLREMLQTFLRVGGRTAGIDFDELGIQDVVELLRGEETDLPAVLRDFGNKTQGEDPVIHFYEHFLTAYDKKLKVRRGVFYTPRPVVSYIVRSVHELLQTEFGLADGLADTTTWEEMAQRHPGLIIPEGVDPDSPFVVILDPATGTATFLVEVIEMIHQTLTAKWQKAGLNEVQCQAAWNEYVPRHLLPRLFGYELMMAPYAIAHMKIGLKLAETGYRFGTEERARIYLTNALEPWVKQLPLIGFDALAHEAAAVNEIKRYKRFTVVIGNPPYAGHSTNTGEWISNLVNDYYSIAGEPLRERNPKWLQDDYVKFIRLAQNTLAITRTGVLGFITNHSFLDNPTFRGMRYSLLATFSELRLLDLHGNSKKREKSPDGSADENVFDIQQGVAITVGRVGAKDGATAVHHAHLYGERHRKYAELSQGKSSQTEWQAVSATVPFYLLFPQDVSIRAEYEKGIRLPEAMRVNVLGFQSHRDGFAVAFDRSEIRERISMFRSATHSDKELAKHFEIPDNRDWQISSARAQVKADKGWEDKIITCAYRPFDFRACYFSSVAMDYPRRELLDHVAWRENLCLNSTRQTKATEWRNAVVTDKPAPAVFVELKDGSNAFPLWLYPDQDGLFFFSSERRPNFSDSFLKALAVALNLSQTKPHGLPAGLTPEDIFHYAYAVFHSLGYRSRYAEFLKIDFPRLPLTSSLVLFRALARLGSGLTALHLVEFALEDEPDAPADWPRYPRLAWFRGNNRTIDRFPAANKAWQDGRVDINNSSGFSGVPEDVWNFHIGGYQVCHKWLKDRKGRTLSDADILHYAKIVTALHETIRLMAEIDGVIEEHGGWPIQ